MIKQSTLDKLGKVGIESEDQLPFYLPTKYFDYTEKCTLLKPYYEGGKRLFALELEYAPKINEKAVPSSVQVTLTDGVTSVDLMFFGTAFLWRRFKAGDTVHIYGEFAKNKKGYLTIKGANLIGQHQVGKVIPRYRGKTSSSKGKDGNVKVRKLLSEDLVFNAVQGQMEGHVDEAVEYMLNMLGDTEANVLEKTAMGFTSLSQWLKALHFPQTKIQAERAMEMAARVGCHEVALAAERNNQKRHDKKSMFRIDGKLMNQMIRNLPYRPTNDQIKAMQDVVRDIKSPFPANRLISGDVGVGKTLVFLLPLIAAQASGAKIGIMVPNLGLMENLYKEFVELFPDVPVLKMKKGRLKKADKEAYEELLKNNSIVIGTQSLIFKKTGVLKDWQANIFVVDEQQKLSTEQREALKEGHTNYFEATATAIPKTMALISHQGMDVSVIKECPVEKTIHTRLVLPESHEEKMMKYHLTQTLNAGKQAAIIYARVDEEAGSGESEKTGVVQAFEKWSNKYPGRVCMLHGQMSDSEKSRIIKAMKGGEYDILICSSIIEVGITFPNLFFVGVGDADSYGISTLHQMRGRPARKGGEGYFYMFSNRELKEETIERLRLMEMFKHNEGFKLSEADMRMRGFGEIVDEGKQHGKTSTFFVNYKVIPDDLVAYQKKKPFIPEKYKHLYDDDDMDAPCLKAEEIARIIEDEELQEANLAIEAAIQDDQPEHQMRVEPVVLKVPQVVVRKSRYERSELNAILSI